MCLLIGRGQGARGDSSMQAHSVLEWPDCCRALVDHAPSAASGSRQGRQHSDQQAGERMGPGFSEEQQSVSEEEGDGEIEELGATLVADWDDAARQQEELRRKRRRSSSSSSSSTSSQAAAEGQDTEEKGDEQGKKTTRTTERRIQFGIHWLTPRLSASGEQIGFQLVCGLSFHRHCSKEMSNAVAKGPQNCKRLLKTWALLGHSMKGREEHMSPKLRADLLDKLYRGQLWEEEALDRCAPHSEDNDVPAPWKEPAAKDAKAAVASHEAPVLLLGERDPSVPPAVQDEMESMARRSMLPITSLQQRQRNKLSEGEYSVPGALQPALKHGFIHPNLQPPEGFAWRAQGGRWRLCAKGG